MDYLRESVGDTRKYKKMGMMLKADWIRMRIGWRMKILSKGLHEKDFIQTCFKLPRSSQPWICH
jgi:hypothetical protein